MKMNGFLLNTPSGVDFVSVYNSNKDFKELTTRYGITLEELSMANKALDSDGRLSVILTEAESSETTSKLDDLKAEITRDKEKVIKDSNLSRVYAWWMLGLYIGGLMTIGAPLLSLILLIASIIFAILSIVRGQKALTYSKKLLASKSKLNAIKRRTNDKDTINKIDDLIDKIEENHASIKLDMNRTD